MKKMLLISGSNRKGNTEHVLRRINEHIEGTHPLYKSLKAKGKKVV